MDTSVISIRLSDVEINQIDVYCLQRGINRTEWLVEQFEKANLLDEVKELLTSMNKRSYYGRKEADIYKLLSELKCLLKI